MCSVEQVGISLHISEGEQCIAGRQFSGDRFICRYTQQRPFPLPLYHKADAVTPVFMTFPIKTEAHGREQKGGEIYKAGQATSINSASM
jgi:hypothetical protein